MTIAAATESLLTQAYEEHVYWIESSRSRARWISLNARAAYGAVNRCASCCLSGRRAWC